MPPSPSAYTSPSPTSPITVIELDTLDNMEDSIGSEDSVSEPIEKDASTENLVSLLQPITEEEGGSSAEQSRVSSYEAMSEASDVSNAR